MQMKISEKYFSLVNTEKKATEEMVDKLQSSEGKTKLKNHQNFRDYYDQMKYMRQAVLFNLKKTLLVKVLKT